MMRALLAVVVLASVAPVSAAAAAPDRLDALATTLRERPLAVDPELAWLLDARQERRILRALQGSPVPIFTAVLPQLETDESGGDPDRIAIALHARLGRPGLYVLIDDHGRLDATAFDVPRRGAQGYELTPSPPKGERDIAFTAVRVERLVDEVVSLPPGTTNEEREPRELEPFEPTFSRSIDEGGASFGDTALGAGVLFGVLGLLAGGWLRVREGRRRRREEKAVKAEAERRRHRAEKHRRRREREERDRARRPWWRRLR